MDHAAVERTLTAARERLLSARAPTGHWEGELSSSALSTATAVCALELLDRASRNSGDPSGGRTDHRPESESVSDADQSGSLTDVPRQSRPYPALIRAGLIWLVDHQNSDGGWGDTADSPSNISTTTLCWAALGIAGERRWCDQSGSLTEGRTPLHSPLAGGTGRTTQRAVERAEAWLKREAGDLKPARLARAVSAVYGQDRTFSAPILTMCALAGRFGTGREAWHRIPVLPFELAACPHKWLRRLGLGVVSYALPALIAVGQARHVHYPTRNPITRCLRNLTRRRTLGILQSIQPAGGGFLEAVPLTSFVVMCLVSMGLKVGRLKVEGWKVEGQRGRSLTVAVRRSVVDRAVGFLRASIREDGSWPIDTNLATWVTTLSVNALAGNRDPVACLLVDERARLRNWLLGQQYHTEHPYTHAAPGGWAWTDLSGGVPDADDTSGALLSLRHLASREKPDGFVDVDTRSAASKGVQWLLGVQNTDGGIPTFCRGWGKLPFDRSSPDLTAHTLRAWNAWRDSVGDELRRRVERATLGAFRYLITTQREDGSWVPLWFGNQRAPGSENPLYGTTRVLRAAEVVPVDRAVQDTWLRACRRGVEWVSSTQNQDGGWGGAASLPSSIEETALAVEALACLVGDCETRGGHASDDGSAVSIVDRDGRKPLVDAITRGSAWLVEHTDGGTRFKPAPIGLYFAKLWYFERLYPLIFTVAALERVCRLRTDRGLLRGGAAAHCGLAIGD